MELYEATRDARTTKVIRAGGWSLIAIGFAVPQIQILSAGEGAAQAGYDMMRSFGQLLLPALIAWFVTRTKTDRAKAIGTVCVGMVVLATSISIAADKASETERTKAFLQTSLTSQAESTARLEKVIDRMSAIDMAKVLTLEAIADKNQRALSKAQLAQFKALLAERRSIVAATYSQAESLVSALPPGEAKRGGLEGLKDAKRNNQELFGDLDVVQLSYAESLEALFTWADTQDGKMQLSGGKVLFADETAVLQFQTLIKNIGTQEELYNKVSEKVTIKQQQLQMRHAEMKREAAKILAK